MMRSVMLVVALAATGTSAQTLPPGPGADLLKARCVSCHEADLITQQKLSLTGWTRSVDKMVRWGATITPEERAVLHPYLAAHFGPKPFDFRNAVAQGRPAASHAASEAGAATYKRACTTCHEADLIEQQRLSRTGWTRSVEKMMRWGATISDTEKEPLIDYLASRFPPR
jgi:hypothetical protein